MKIGIIGGTGGMGKGFASRWCKKNDVIIGSRDAERAVAAAAEYTTQAVEAYGEINGTINYTGNKQIIIEAVNLDNDLVYRKILDRDEFLFDKLTPGNYNIWAYEHLNKVTMNYFSGRLEPLELAAKYVEYNKDVAVRANWKNTINMEIK